MDRTPPPQTPALSAPAGTSPRWLRRLLMVTVPLLILASFYCSLVPDPHMTRIVPGWIGKWADKHTILRTAVPFLAMAFLLGVLWFRDGQTAAQRRQAWKRAIGLPSLTVTLCELAQIPLPKRVADARDILLGIAGAIVGAMLAWILRQAVGCLRPKMSAVPDPAASGQEAPSERLPEA